MNSSALESLFVEPSKIGAVFAKIVTPNDDSGRHGVVVPVAAHAFFPTFPGFLPSVAVNHTVPIRTIWREGGEILERESSYKHYHRYPERRLTALGSKQLNARSANALLVVGRRSDRDLTYEIHVVVPMDPIYGGACRELGIEMPQPGAFVALQPWQRGSRARPISETVEALILRFDALKAEGFVPSLREGGSRGVGNTFELRMGASENNRPEADHNGVELKSMLKNEFKRESADETKLFLKEPTWIDGLDGSERVRQYGYVDENGRPALYSGVKAKENSHGLALRVDRTSERVYLDRRGVAIAYWTFSVLEKPLREKLEDTLYALADSRGSDANETFWYHTLFYLRGPSVQSFVNIIEDGRVSLQLRMHVEAGRPLRNHGSQFRVSMNRWPQLFGEMRALRGKGTDI